MEHLRDGIGLRGYGQRDPKKEYKKEGYDLFLNMMAKVSSTVLVQAVRGADRSAKRRSRRIEAESRSAPPAPSSKPPSRVTRAKTDDPVARGQMQRIAAGHGPTPPSPAPPRGPKIGRNDPCPCGSGKKFKKCHGALLEEEGADDDDETEEAAAAGVIEVEGLTKDYGTVVAVRDVSFSVGSGEVVGFLGPNGAGKSTTLRILAGFLGATSGRVRIAGHDIAEAPLAGARVARLHARERAALPGAARPRIPGVSRAPQGRAARQARRARRRRHGARGRARTWRAP